MSVIIDTPDGMKFFQLLQFRARFQVEISTGMGHRIPTLKAYNQIYGTKFGRKQQALNDCIRRIEEALVIRHIQSYVENHETRIDPRTELSCEEMGCVVCNAGDKDEAVQMVFAMWKEGLINFDLDKEPDEMG